MSMRSIVPPALSLRAQRTQSRAAGAVIRRDSLRRASARASPAMSAASRMHPGAAGPRSDIGVDHGPVRDRAAGAALRGQAAADRLRAVSARCRPARTGARLCTALAARACAHPVRSISRRHGRRRACWRSIPARIWRRPGSARWGCRSSGSGRTGRRCSGGRIAGWPRGGCAMSASRSRLSSPRPPAQARDAAELIDIDYEMLPSVTDTAQAAEGKSRSGTNAPTTSRTCSRPATGRRPTPPLPRRRMSSSAAM